MTKTAIDSSTASAGATVALLNGSQDFGMVDLWNITLSGGASVKWNAGPYESPQPALSSIGFTHFGSQPAAADGTYALGPAIDRGKITTKLGTQSTSMDATIRATSADLINGSNLLAFTAARGFDGAFVTIWRGYFPLPWAVTGNLLALTGVVHSFAGLVTSIKDITRSGFSMTISSPLILLDANMGPDVYQRGCLNQHYDANCGLTASLVTGTVAASPAPTTTTYDSNLTQADHFFDKGVLTFTTGANAGVKRAVQTYLNAGGSVELAYPLPVAPANGDQFTVARGCLLTLADCIAQSNSIHFRGQPFIPAAVNSVTGLPGAGA